MHRRRPQPPAAALAACTLALLLVVWGQERPPECVRTPVDDWNSTEIGTNDYWGVMGLACNEAMSSCSAKCRTTLQRVRGASQSRCQLRPCLLALLSYWLLTPGLHALLQLGFECTVALKGQAWT